VWFAAATTVQVGRDERICSGHATDPTCLAYHARSDVARRKLQLYRLYSLDDFRRRARGYLGALPGTVSTSGRVQTGMMVWLLLYAFELAADTYRVSAAVIESLT